MSIEAIKHYEAALLEAFPRGATGDVFEHWNNARKAIAEAEKQEPVAYPEGDVVGACVCGSWPGGKCLKCPRITHPQPKREPLTDEQAQEVRIKAYSRDIDSDMALIRETEAAHGIKGEA